MESLEEKLRASAVDNKVPCATAFKVAKEFKVGRKNVGDAANRLKIRFVDCQLGCFQVKKATHEDLDSVTVEAPLADRIKSSLVEGYLPCAMAFKVAKDLNVTPRRVGDAVSKQKIKIVQCQLGCF
ncbi:MAG: hypothetical protein HYX79_03910 [Chloroflexi bacterium]|nr:hypothetical protein [Chloroflexota bacterium]